MRKLKKKQKKTIIILILLALLIPAALFNGPIIRKYKIESDKVQQNITIAVIADLHNQNFGENQKQIVDRLIDSSPDIILFPGDMTNSLYSIDAMVNLMEQAVKIAPCYYVLGNHEYWSYTAPEICETISSIGVIVLHNNSSTINISGTTLEIFGIDDLAANQYDPAYINYTWSQKLKDMWTENIENNFRILLSHRPAETAEYKQYEYDLIVSGHTHGGLVRIPILLNGLYAPDQGYFPKYAGGKYKLTEITTMIVSRGLYNYKNMPRVFNPSEVVIITISQKH